MSTEDFYRAFEDRHRGSRTLIKERLSVYLPFILPLKDHYPQAIALDIGCGRGEWLELLKENNFLAQGVDLDDGMLKACHEMGLDVQQDDGISYLKRQKSESITIVTAFHVVEHISFEVLQEFVQEALRVLKPGGLLIMETPNPENIKVATVNFYLDPTHTKPIPPNLLSFLPEFYGFSRTKTIRLQESKELMELDSVNLQQVFEGASSDYAVITQKSANKQVLNSLNEIFAKDFGLSLNALTDKFDYRQQLFESKVIQVEEKAIHAESKAIHADVKVDALKVQIDVLEANYHTLLNSYSWKITKPLRFLGKSIRKMKRILKDWFTFTPSKHPKQIMKKKLISLQNHVKNNPRLKMKIKYILYKFPAFRSKIQNILLDSNMPIESDEINKKSFFKGYASKHGTLNAEDIYNEISKELKNRKEHQ